MLIDTKATDPNVGPLGVQIVCYTVVQQGVNYISNSVSADAKS